MSPKSVRPERLYGVEEVAEHLGVSTKTIYRLIKSGGLQVHRIGKSIRISGPQLAAYLTKSQI
jgi:excisionase family DNA binding protein